MILLDYQGEILNKTRAATLDNLFSPRTGTEITYVPLLHNMQFSPMFPYVPLQILYFPYKYCIFVWKIHCRAAKFGWFKSWWLFAHLVQKNFFRREFFLTPSPPPTPPPPSPKNFRSVYHFRGRHTKMFRNIIQIFQISQNFPRNLRNFSQNCHNLSHFSL
jgi:hypothetical protein